MRFEISYTLKCARAVNRHLGWSYCGYGCLAVHTIALQVHVPEIHSSTDDNFKMAILCATAVHARRREIRPEALLSVRSINENLCTEVLITQVLITLSIFHTLKQKKEKVNNRNHNKTKHFNNKASKRKLIISFTRLLKHASTLHQC